MTTVTDWKGNEIKEGMEVCIIQTNTDNYFRDSKTGLPFTPIVDCWDIKTYLVESKNGNLVINTTTKGANEAEGYTFHFSNPISMLTWTSKNCIIAIKGISDNEEEYRNHLQTPTP